MPESTLSINLRKLNTVLVLALIISAGTYFFTTNSLSTKGFAFKSLKEQANQLTLDKQHMESQITSLASYQSLDTRIKDLSLVTSKEVGYISWNSLVVARK